MGARATPVAYSLPTSFGTAVAGISGASSQTLNFDSQAAGTVIPSGGSDGGITFTYNLGAVQLQVSTGNQTTSLPNYLGTTDLGVFQGGDAFTLTFSQPTNAVGMSFITSPDPINNGDLTLTGGGTTASLVAADQLATLSDGGKVFFLGLVDGTTPFTSASIGGSGPFFLFNVDDVVTAAVPESTPFGLVAMGMVGLSLARRRRRQSLGGMKAACVYSIQASEEARGLR
jgi:MYXO-CTERM domain-containing protein